MSVHNLVYLHDRAGQLCTVTPRAYRSSLCGCGRCAAFLPWDVWFGRWTPPFRIDPPLPEPSAPRAPDVTIDESKRVPAPVPSDEVTGHAAPAASGSAGAR